MELYEMKQSLSKNQNKLKSMGISLDLDSKRKQIEENNQKMQEADFWILSAAGTIGSRLLYCFSLG